MSDMPRSIAGGENGSQTAQTKLHWPGSTPPEAEVETNSTMSNGKSASPQAPEALPRFTTADGAQVHDADKTLVSFMPLQVIAALRRRRAKFANVEGPVTAGRLRTGFMLSYAAPSFSTVPLTMLISVYVIQFYEVLGASLSMLAFFQALARSFDVVSPCQVLTGGHTAFRSDSNINMLTHSAREQVSDPLMSYWTDSVRSKFGRRRPFLVSGCIPYCICLILLLTPGMFTTTDW